MGFQGQRWITALIFVLVGVSGFARAEDQPYTLRPSIREVVAQPLTRGQPAQWANFKESMLRFIAELTTLYKDEELFFLARDGEYLFDLCQALFAEEPALRDRIHLLNVSTYSKDSRNLIPYLEQQGLTPEVLSKRGAILVDTGFIGSIPKSISQSLKDAKWKDLGSIRAHLVGSENEKIPYSRVFLENVSPDADHLSRDGLRELLSGYEGLPHYTRKSTHFWNIDGKWVPVAKDFGSFDGGSAKVRRQEAKESARLQEQSRKLMADLRAYAEDPATRERIRFLRERMALLSDMALGRAKPDPGKARQALDELRAQGVNGFVKDLEDVVRTRNVKVPKRVFNAFLKGVSEPEQGAEASARASARRKCRLAPTLELLPKP